MEKLKKLFEIKPPLDILKENEILVDPWNCSSVEYRLFNKLKKYIFQCYFEVFWQNVSCLLDAAISYYKL